MKTFIVLSILLASAFGAPQMEQNMEEKKEAMMEFMQVKSN